MTLLWHATAAFFIATEGVTAAVLSECGYNGRFQAADSEVHRDGTTGIFRHSQPMCGRVHFQ